MILSTVLVACEPEPKKHQSVDASTTEELTAHSAVGHSEDVSSRHSGELDGVDDDADGFSEADGDCNDDSADVRPGAPESCANGIDDNCDGGVDCRLEGIRDLVIASQATVGTSDDSDYWTTRSVNATVPTMLGLSVPLAGFVTVLDPTSTRSLADAPELLSTTDPSTTPALVDAGRDYSGDGQADLVIDEGEAVYIHTQGAGDTMISDTAVAVTNILFAWPLGDTDGDGDADLLVSPSRGGLRRLDGPFVGVTDGATHPGQDLDIDVLTSFARVESVSLLGDLTGDGSDDAAICVADRFRNQGHCAVITDWGSITALSQAQGSVEGYPGWLISAGDLDEDGIVDFVTLDVEDSFRTQSLRVYSVTPQAALTEDDAWATFSLDGYQGRGAALVDLNGDDRSDLVTLANSLTTPDTAVVAITYAPIPHGAAPFSVDHSLQSSTRYAYQLAVGEFDGSGTGDLCVVSHAVMWPYWGRKHRVHFVPGGSRR